MADRSRTKSQRGNRGPTPTDTNHPDDGPTMAADPDPDPDADTEVVAGVTHYHGGERDFHRHGLGAHHHIDGRLVDGAWAPPGVKLWEYVGIADVNEHRHDDRHTHSHDPFGQQEHFHNPSNNAVLPLPADGWPVEYQPRQLEVPAEGQSHDPPEVEASQARHPSGREPADGLPTDPEERAALAAQYRHALAEIDGSAPTPDRVPAVPAKANPAAGRLGTDLGGLELVKASFRAMFPGAPDGLDQEWALTMGASDLLGQMLNQHRRPAFADPGLIAGLRTLVEQLDEAAAAREACP